MQQAVMPDYNNRKLTEDLPVRRNFAEGVSLIVVSEQQAASRLNEEDSAARLPHGENFLCFQHLKQTTAGHAVAEDERYLPGRLSVLIRNSCF